MPFSLTTRQVDNVVVIDMQGRLTAGEAVQSLRTTVRRLVDDGSRNFVLNLGGVSFLDSSGLGELITTHTTLRNRKANLRLSNLPKIVRDLLQLTKLITVFETHEDESAAIRSLRNASAF